MSQIDKLREKFYKVPIPTDIRIDEVIKLAKSYKCIVKTGGNHPILIVHKETGTVIPIPCHGDFVKPAYIKELKDLFNTINGK